MMIQQLEKFNLRHLRMIQSVGRMGGVSSASRTLYTSQPTITHALAKFEDRLGIRIFKRTATGCYPTQQGQLYLLRIDRFLEILDNAIARLLSPVDGRMRHKQQVDRLITGTQIRSLIALSDQDQMYEYASALSVSPHSLLRSARKLERVLATPLLRRSEQGLIPNYTGHFLADEFKRAVKEIEGIYQAPFYGIQPDRPEVRVGVLPMAGLQILAEAMQLFVATYPAVRIRVISGGYHQLLMELTSKRIDMIFGALRGDDGDTDGISRETLFNDRYCVVARPDHPLTRYEQVMPAEIVHFKWVGPPKGTPRRTRIDTIFKGMQLIPDVYLETTSHAMSRELLHGSDMITLMTRSAAHYDLTHGILSELHCPFFDDALLVGLMTRTGWQPSAPHTAFYEALRATTL